jgi:hypothetical protein
MTSKQSGVPALKNPTVESWIYSTEVIRRDKELYKRKGVA